MGPTMRKLSVLLLFVAVVACSKTDPKAVRLRIKGSESMHETFFALKNDFEKMQDSVKIDLEGGGSRLGMMGVHEDAVDIGLSSFRFDLDSLLGINHNIQAATIAFDGIVLISNDSNPLQRLSNEQVSAIFEGTVTDWGQLGGLAGPIRPVIRNQNSGTQRFFTEYFGIDQVTPQAAVAKENADIVSAVSTDEQSIGFIGFAYFTASVKDLLVPSSFANKDTAFVAPTFSNLENGSYPLKRPLQVYFKNLGNPAVDAFLAYLQTERARLVIATHGLVPIPEFTQFYGQLD